MKRVCVLSTVELSRMTMLSLYTSYFRENNIEYDIICAKKTAINEDPFASHIFEFDAHKTENGSLFEKVLHFRSMISFVKDVFAENEYDFIVVWNQVTTFFFTNILIRRFDKKYCVNIRDYHFDDYPFIRARLKKALKHSRFNTISSDAFTRFLPKGNYVMIHSLNESLVSTLEKHTNKRKTGERIRILNIGQIRYCEQNIFPFIDELANDDRFEIIFAGTGSEKVDQYICNKSINNVKIYGRFPATDTPLYLKDADIIFNLYGTGNLHVDTALSIKLYYSVYLQIPILTYKGTHMDEVATNLGIGISIMPYSFSGIGDLIMDFYEHYDPEKIASNCTGFVKEIKKSHNALYHELDFLVEK